MWRPVRGIFANGRVKVASLVVATLLYLHVYTERKQEASFDVPIHVNDVAPGLAVALIDPTTARVTVRGTGKDMLRMRIDPPQLILEGRGLGVESHQLPTASARVALPVHSDAQVIEIESPGVVHVEMDSLVSARLPVYSPTIGMPGPGYAIAESPRLTPDSVDVFGPAAVVEQMTSVQTTTIDMSGVRKSLRRDLRLVVPAAVVSQPNRVRVFVAVAPGGD